MKLNFPALFKAFCISILLSIVSTIQGQSITPEEALGTAQEFFKDRTINTNLQLVYTAEKNGRSIFYLFNDYENSLYIIISADHKTQKILGYSNSGIFAIDNMDKNHQWFLESLKEGMYDYLQKPEAKSIVRSNTAPARQTIAPMVEVAWSQEYPYNMLIPRPNSATGCVATAMAQIMYKWKHPQQGIGNKTYEKRDADGIMYTYSANFEETIYDWDSMRLAYVQNPSIPYTQRQKEAVATLMYHCGVAVTMSFNSESSADLPTVAPSMAQYFGYDWGMSCETKARYSNADWEELIYQELAADRPVLYSGRNYSTGHAFVCHGYDNSTNLFCINWGWGLSDEYTSLSYMGGEFNRDNMAVIGIQPAQSTPQYRIRMTTAATVKEQAGSRQAKTEYQKNEKIRYEGSYKALCSNNFTADVGIEFRKISNDSKFIVLAHNLPFTPDGSSWNSMENISLQSLPFAGMCELRPVYRFEGESDWKYMEVSSSWVAPIVKIIDPNTTNEEEPNDENTENDGNTTEDEPTSDDDNNIEEPNEPDEDIETYLENQNNDLFSIRSSDNSIYIQNKSGEIGTISIFDTMGRIIIHKGIRQTLYALLPKGTYIVAIHTENHFISRKVILQ